MLAGLVGVEMAARRQARLYLAVFFAGAAAGVLVDVESMLAGRKALQVRRQCQAMVPPEYAGSS
jgi:hypothetical protein